MGRLIDADHCLIKAWQNFYKQEEEHEKNIDDYDIMRDQFYEQSGFECCQQTIVNAPTIEAIPREKIDEMIKEIDEMRAWGDDFGNVYLLYDKVKEIIHKYCDKEQTNG